MNARKADSSWVSALDCHEPQIFINITARVLMNIHNGKTDLGGSLRTLDGKLSATHSASVEWADLLNQKSIKGSLGNAHYSSLLEILRKIDFVKIEFDEIDDDDVIDYGVFA